MRECVKAERLPDGRFAVSMDGQNSIIYHLMAMLLLTLSRSSSGAGGVLPTAARIVDVALDMELRGAGEALRETAIPMSLIKTMEAKGAEKHGGEDAGAD